MEVIHLAHNRSVQELVDTAIEEDAQGIAMSSYQGGHMESFKYMIDLLKQRGASHIKVFGGGGGVIVADEIAELEAYGVTKIYSPEDGATMGLQGMANHMIEQMDFSTLDHHNLTPDALNVENRGVLAGFITALQQAKASNPEQLKQLTALIGPLADAPYEQLGTWIFDGDPNMSVTPRQAIESLVGDEIDISYVRAMETSRTRTTGLPTKSTLPPGLTRQELPRRSK